MAIAKQLQEVDPFFMQDCPMCGRSNRMVVKGVYVRDGKREIYPDMGYSFCNCKDIFYTKYENINKDAPAAFEKYQHPLDEMRRVYDATPAGKVITLVLPDPFFCDWGTDPYAFKHWRPREVHILWDINGICKELKAIGFIVESAEHDFNVQNKDSQTMIIKVEKP